MAEPCKRAAYRILFLIATPKLIHKATELWKEEKVPVQYLFHAQGTASSEIMDLLGLGGIEKNILQAVMPKSFADRMLKKLKNQLYLGMPNTGIAFTMRISGCSGRLIQLMEETMPVEAENGQSELRRDEEEMMDNAYNMVVTIVDQGYSEQVMDAARAAGAAGGTVFHSRRIGSGEAMKFWGIHVQQERETVLILVRKEDKRTIMKAIGEKCGMNSEAHGIVLSMPVDEIVGLGE